MAPAPTKVIKATAEDAPSGSRRCCATETVHLTDPTLPAWLADPHIQRGYRLPGGWCKTFQSLFSCHNETLNVYTHGIGVVFFLVVGVALVLGRGWGPGGSSFTLPAFATPHQDDVLAATLRHFSEGAKGAADTLGAAFRSAVPAAAPAGASAPTAWCAAAPAVAPAAMPLILGGRHTARLLAARRPASSSPAGSGGVVEAAATALAGLTQGASARLETAAAELDRLVRKASRDGRAAAEEAVGAVNVGLGRAGRAAEEAMGEARAAAGALQAAAAGYLEGLRAAAGKGEGWEPRRALASLASTADSLERELERELDAALEAAARALGVEEERRRLEGAGLPSGAGHVRSMAGAGWTASSAPRWPVLVFVVSALVCLGCSVAFHLFWVVSERASRVLQRLDYSGIAMLIGGSCCPIIEYALACDRTAATLAAAFMYVMCAAAVVIGMSDRFSTEAWRPVRGGLFVATGLAGAGPILYVAATLGHDPVIRQALLQVVVMGAMYVSGAALYVTRVPERWFPGKLDLFGASHQIFHTLVFVAAVLHYHTVLLMFRWRDMQPACAAA